MQQTNKDNSVKTVLKAVLYVSIILAVIIISTILVTKIFRVNSVENQLSNYVTEVLTFEPDVKDAYEAQEVDSESGTKNTYCDYQTKKVEELNLETKFIKPCENIPTYGMSVLAKWHPTKVEIKNISENKALVDIYISYKNWDTILTAPEEFNEYKFDTSNHTLHLQNIELDIIEYERKYFFDFTQESKARLGQLYIGWDREDYVFVDLAKDEVIQLFKEK